MSPENQPNTTKICPTCGTRLGINATRCSVCGSNLAPSVAVASAKAVAGPRIPEVTLSLPVIFGLAILLLVVGAGAVYAILQGLGDKAPAIGAAASTPTGTATQTVTVTATPTITKTPTLAFTWTPEPPVEYKVATGDTCLGIALVYGVSIDSIAQLNNLGAGCTAPLTVGQSIKIPKPTPTASPQPSNTPNATEIASAECSKVEYLVKDGDTMGKIAGNYAVSSNSIIAYNSKQNDTVYVGEKLIIPLCEQQLETPTPTAVPPYGAPNLLLPADGASYNPTDLITLQWASVGELRTNEAYAVTVEDVTAGEARKWVDYVTDSKFNLPEAYRPASTTPHVYRWSILTVRQTGTDKDSGKPIWEPAGDVSIQRVFSWTGTGSNPPPAPEASATPTP